MYVYMYIYIASLLIPRRTQIFFSPHVFIFPYTYVCSFYFLLTLLQREWCQNMFFFFLLTERDALN